MFIKMSNYAQDYAGNKD